MPQKPETKFRAAVDRDLAKLRNGWFESIQQKAIQGTPDKLGCINGHFIGIELKANGHNQPTALQDLKLKKIAQAGGIALLAHPDNWAETFQLLQHLDEETAYDQTLLYHH
jgi:hypothetical protein